MSETFFISEKQWQWYFAWALFFIGEQLLTQIKAFVLKSAIVCSSNADNFRNCFSVSVQSCTCLAGIGVMM